MLSFPSYCAACQLLSHLAFVDTLRMMCTTSRPLPSQILAHLVQSRLRRCIRPSSTPRTQDRMDSTNSSVLHLPRETVSRCGADHRRADTAPAQRGSLGANSVVRVRDAAWMQLKFQRPGDKLGQTSAAEDRQHAELVLREHAAPDRPLHAKVVQGPIYHD